MARGIALLQRDPDSVIVFLGNQAEAAYMHKLAVGTGIEASRVVADGNSNTTIDNACYAKQICRQYGLKPAFLVTSQYQISRAVTTFRRVLGPNYALKPSPSPSLTSTKRRLRETILRIITPLLLFLFRSGDDAALKHASDLAWTLLLSRTR